MELLKDKQPYYYAAVIGLIKHYLATNNVYAFTNLANTISSRLSDIIVSPNESVAKGNLMSFEERRTVLMELVIQVMNADEDLFTFTENGVIYIKLKKDIKEG